MVSRDAPIFHVPEYQKSEVFLSLSQTVDWGLSLLGVDDAWKVSRGKDVKVAILDTGVDLNHPDLHGQVLDAKDFSGSAAGFRDTNGHGTFCAGVVAANDNDTGVIGVAPEAKLYCGKVLGDGGNGSSNYVSAGIRWAISEGVDIISMSLGSTSTTNDLYDAVKQAVANNIIVIAAAGNNGPSLDTINYPARYPEVISVGAINRSMQVASFSSRGDRVDICGPGNDVLSCYPPSRYVKMSGSSMACPFIAGSVALLIGAIKQRNLPPLRGYLDLRNRLQKSATPVGPKQSYGFGVINPTYLMTEDGKITFGPEDFTTEGFRKVTSLIDMTTSSVDGKQKVNIDVEWNKFTKDLNAIDY